MNKAIARVDALRSRMDQLGRCYDLIMQLTQMTELQRFERDRKIAASRVQGMDRQRRQVDRDIDNVQGVVAAAQEFQSLVNEVIESLRADHGLVRGIAQKEAA